MSKPLRVFHQLHMAHGALFRAADRHMRASEGITTAHQVILFTLTIEDGLRASDVAKRAGHSKSRLTNLVDTLEAKKLLKRRTSEGDGRVHTLHITQAGRDLIKRHTARTKELNEEMLAPFDATERDVIATFLKHVRNLGENS